MRRIAVATLLLAICGPAVAHEPLFTPPLCGYADPIPPVGNNLPLSYRARYNRPRYIGGKIAYHIAPSSQEAMTWHDSVHRGDYAQHAPWSQPLYIYPKPWEVLPVGPRTPVPPQVLAGPPLEP